MLRRPTNFYPYGQPIDFCKEGGNEFSFTFNGDKFDWCTIDIIDTDNSVANEGGYIWRGVITTPQSSAFVGSYNRDTIILDESFYNQDVIKFTIPQFTTVGQNGYSTIKQNPNHPTDCARGCVPRNLIIDTTVRNIIYERPDGGAVETEQKTFSAITYFISETKPTVNFVLDYKQTSSGALPQVIDGVYIVPTSKVGITGKYDQSERVGLKSFHFILKDGNGDVLTDYGEFFSSDIQCELEGLQEGEQYYLDAYFVDYNEFGFEYQYIFEPHYTKVLQYDLPVISELDEDLKAVSVKWFKDKFMSGSGTGYLVQDGSVTIGNNGAINYQDYINQPYSLRDLDYGVALRTTINQNTKDIITVFKDNKSFAKAYVEFVSKGTGDTEPHGNWKVTANNGNYITKSVDILSSYIYGVQSYSTPLKNVGYYMPSDTSTLWVSDNSHYWLLDDFAKTFRIVCDAKDVTIIKEE